MSVEVDYIYYDNVFQGTEVVGWSWEFGAPTDGRFWSVAIVPELANVTTCEMIRFFWSTDNNQGLTANVTIRVDEDGRPGGVVVGFKAIRAPSV